MMFQLGLSRPVGWRLYGLEVPGSILGEDHKVMVVLFRRHVVSACGDEYLGWHAGVIRGGTTLATLPCTLNCSRKATYFVYRQDCLDVNKRSHSYLTHPSYYLITVFHFVCLFRFPCAVVSVLCFHLIHMSSCQAVYFFSFFHMVPRASLFLVNWLFERERHPSWERQSIPKV